MKTFKLILSAIFFLAFSYTVTAQEKTEKFKVSGNCGMCKNKIEKAAKAAGATYALWDEDSKELEVKFESSSTNAAKIQQKIAETGYDNAGFKATNEAYDKLHGCCKYDRETATAAASCCEGGKCTKEECKTCCADGKCTKGMECCADGKCAKGDDCCAEGKCSMDKHKEKSKKKGSLRKA